MKISPTVALALMIPILGCRGHNANNNSVEKPNKPGVIREDDTSNLPPLIKPELDIPPAAGGNGAGGGEPPPPKSVQMPVFFSMDFKDGVLTSSVPNEEQLLEAFRKLHGNEAEAQAAVRDVNEDIAFVQKLLKSGKEIRVTVPAEKRDVAPLDYPIDPVDSLTFNQQMGVPMIIDSRKSSEVKVLFDEAGNPRVELRKYIYDNQEHEGIFYFTDQGDNAAVMLPSNANVLIDTDKGVYYINPKPLGEAPMPKVPPPNDDDLIVGVDAVIASKRNITAA